MGNTSSGATKNTESPKRGSNTSKKGSVGTKRKKKDKDNPTSSKKAKLETAKYVYDKLFVEGQDSDISITALGYRWKLHKFYLKQCDFFSVLLDGKWADSKTSEFTLDIPDEDITKDGLHSVLGALYDNEIMFDVDKLRSIIATAAYFQMTEIFDKASEAMASSIDDNTLIQFLECAFKYQIHEVTTKAFDYLRFNFWRLSKNVSFLRDLPKEALIRLLSISDLPVNEGEMDLYKAIRTWIFLQESDSYNGDDMKELEDAVSKHLKLLKYAWDNDVDSLSSTPSETRPSSSVSSFDEIAETFQSKTVRQPFSLFLKYSQLFAGLRLHSLCCSTAQIITLQEDGLLPHSLIDAVIADKYITQLAMDENRAGTVNAHSLDGISEEAFLLSCTRFGRSIDSLPKCWRWTGSHFGVDLLMNMQNRMLTLKRNVFMQQQLPTYSLNVRNQIVISYRALILSETGIIIKEVKRETAILNRDSLVIVARFDVDELPPKFSVHLFVMYGCPSPNPSFVLVRNAVNQMKHLMKPVLEMDNVSLIDYDEEKEEKDEEDDCSTEKSTDSYEEEL